jgi:hypothetical protein
MSKAAQSDELAGLETNRLDLSRLAGNCRGHISSSCFLLEAIGKANIPCEGHGVVGHRVEKGARLKACKVDRYDNVPHWSPSNFKAALIAQIASVAGRGRIDQHSTSESVTPSCVDSRQYQSQAKAAVTLAFN